MSRKIQTQRAYKIPKKFLGHFLISVDVNFNIGSDTHYEASYIFDEGMHYCVVLNEYGVSNGFTLDAIKEWVNNYESD